MALTLSLHFPMGRYAAASWDDRERPEWPPHPARLALALVDVLHKAGNTPAMRSAIEWLCSLGAPELVVPVENRIDIRRMDGYFVPQNPTQAESVKHPRKSRAFPSVLLDSEIPTVFFHWRDAAADAEKMDVLRNLVGRLPRFGHSSSLVIAEASTNSPPEGPNWRQWVPVDVSTTGERIRIPYPDLLEAAEREYDASGRAAERDELIRRSERGVRPDKMLRPAASVRGRHDPRHLWQIYAPPGEHDAIDTAWDRRILVLGRVGGDHLGLRSIWQVADTFHKALLDRWSRDPALGPVPSWISGHQPGEGKTAFATANHLSVFPIGDVGHPHAKGRLMGLGLAFPRPKSAGIDPLELRLDWRKAMSALFPNGEALELARADRSWVVSFQPTDITETRVGLQPDRWVREGRAWASVTPVILDRHPKPHFRKDPTRWTESCEEIVRSACARIGLPEPVEVYVSPYSKIKGVSPSMQFEPPLVRTGRPPRFHIHVELVFDRDVTGPVLLGAGRFRGYGLLMPQEKSKSESPSQP
jgi:CRISPR-associated protein Csb2